MARRYVVVGGRAWSRRIFDESISNLPGIWTYIERSNQLKAKTLRRLSPEYVFFLHWSERVPETIVRAFECVAFHMTDLPYGRGGSPLQHLILSGKKTTKLTAFRMTNEFDAGPIYGKQTLRLNGTAEQIYERACSVAARMISSLIRKKRNPIPQRGKVVRFRRRKPEESRLPDTRTTRQLYDFIRMLDADGYPHAFVDHENYRIEFRNAQLRGVDVLATARIFRIPLKQR